MNVLMPVGFRSLEGMRAGGPGNLGVEGLGIRLSWVMPSDGSM